MYPEAFHFNAAILSEAFQTGWNFKGNERGHSSIKGGVRRTEGFERVELVDVGFEYGVDPPAMQAAFEANLFKFSATKAAYQSEEVNALFRKATSFSEFKKLVAAEYGVKNQNWLQTEYNHAYAVGESSATYHRLLAQIETFPYWEYRTIGDDKVRKAHMDLHGRILPAGHALWSTVWTPNDWSCRCYVVPRLAGAVDESKVQTDIAFVQNYIATSPAWKKAIKKGFGTNPAESLEVFTEQQMYSDQPGAVVQRITSTMTATEWGLLDILSKQGKATTVKPSGSSATSGQVADYAGRSIATAEGQVIDDVILDILEAPDEVWHTAEQFTYLRYYANDTQKVTATITKEGFLEITSNTVAKEADRIGLLIKE